MLFFSGALPGNAFGFTGGGLVMAINALYPKLVQLKGTRKWGKQAGGCGAVMGWLNVQRHTLSDL